jgi:hypothetical protein
VFGHSAAICHERSTPTRKGDRVRFHRADIFLPDTSEVGTARTGGEDLEGTVVGFSDSGEVAHAFAIVEMTMGQSAIVRVEKLTKIATISQEPLPGAE